jgi:isopenicillin-N epimerase
VESILNCVTERTRLALVDHVTSQTALVLPIGRIVSGLAQLGIDTLVDGAHAPGMVPVNVQEIGAAYYTGNCHKWICAPKSAGFLCVRRDRQQLIRPLSISHGANSPRKDRSRFLIEFGWTGTWDASACLSVPAALRIMGSLLPGGWPELMERNHQLVLAGRNILCEALKIRRPCVDELIGSMASLPLTPALVEQQPSSPLYSDPLQDKLRAEYGIELPIIPWPMVTRSISVQPRLLRISAQLYNSIEQFSKLAEALKGIGVC